MMLLSGQHEPVAQAGGDLENHRLLLVYEGVELLKAFLSQVTNQEGQGDILWSKKTIRDAPVSSLMIPSLSG